MQIWRVRNGLDSGVIKNSMRLIKQLRRFIVKVKTDYEGCEYITTGKEYECSISIVSGIPYIINDNGTASYIDLDEVNCPHLNHEGTWSIVE